MPSSKLQKEIAHLLTANGIEFVENSRPHWLLSGRGTRLELDFYIPGIGVAIEVQGEQHERYVKFFHKDYSAFLRTKEDDGAKRARCAECGIRLFVVYDSQDAESAVTEICGYYKSEALSRVIKMIPIGKNSKRSEKNAQSALNLIVKVVRCAIKNGFSDEYLTKKRKVNLVSSLRCISVNYGNYPILYTEEEIELIRTAIIIASDFLKECPQAC